VMGYTLEEVLGRSCHDFMDQDCAGRCWVNHPELAEPVRGLRCGLRTKNGETRIILKNVELLRSSTGTVIGAIESFEDITEREQIERRLRVSETRYRSLYSNMQSGFGLYELVVDEDDRPVDFRLLEINPAYEHMLGESIHNPVGKYISQLFPTSSVDFIRRYGPVAAGGGPLRLEEYLPEVQRSFNVLAYAPEINQLAVLLEDVTDLQKAEAGRHAALQMIDTLREISRGVIYRLETEAVAEWILARLNDILPFDTAFILLVEPHSLIVQHQFWQGVKHDQRRINKNRLDETWLFTRMAGSVRTLVVSDVMREPEWQGEPGQEDVRSFAGVPILIRDELAGFICCESLTTGFYRMEAVQKPLLTVAALAALALDNARHSGEKQYQVTHDPLTGLNNHVIFQSLFEHALELARRQQRKLALIYLDLIGFKAVNEVFGRDHGDKVLRSVAERLQASLRQCDILARPGEDEFLVLLENIAREEDASTVARKLGKVLAEPHIIQGQEVVVPAGSGLAVFPRDGNSSDELFEAARISLDSARKQLSG